MADDVAGGCSSPGLQIEWLTGRGKAWSYIMDKEEFIMKLQHALAGGLSGSQTAEHVRYYREYIDSEIHKGRTEEEILAQLGEPRLLARSILDANRRSGSAYGAAQEYDDEVGANAREDSVRGENNQVRKVALPGWFVMLIIIVIIMLVIGVVSSLLYLFAPVIMAALIVLLIVKVIQGSHNRR
ncbi:MAG: DUF1700 domain-containing protein [Lachnospiraceae bacterium]|nr:DUF1700 domain-containing protein [Lachnospiraceae bacterium]